MKGLIKLAGLALAAYAVYTAGSVEMFTTAAYAVLGMALAIIPK